VARPAWKP